MQRNGFKISFPVLSHVNTTRPDPYSTERKTFNTLF